MSIPFLNHSENDAQRPCSSCVIRVSGFTLILLVAVGVFVGFNTIFQYQKRDPNQVFSTKHVSSPQWYHRSNRLLYIQRWWKGEAEHEAIVKLDFTTSTKPNQEAIYVNTVPYHDTCYLALSPDDTKFVYSCNEQILVISAESGAVEKRIAERGDYPWWEGPNLFHYTRYVDGQLPGKIYQYNLSTGISSPFASNSNPRESVAVRDSIQYSFDHSLSVEEVYISDLNHDNGMTVKRVVQ